MDTRRGESSGIQLEVENSKDVLENRELSELSLSDLANIDSFLKRGKSTSQAVRVGG